MDWLAATLDQLAAMPEWSYRAGGVAATEPTAWAALALAAHGRVDAARRAQDWLVQHQSSAGSLGISAQEDAPHWPTGIAVLAWAMQPAWSKAGPHPFRSPVDKAVRWMFSIQGKPTPRHEVLGHDTTLIGWPWVEGTHTWLEPTALYLLALKAIGRNDHVRAVDAVRILLDRQLPTGGCNYGNTFVLGQELRPHLEPSGLALWALQGEHDPSGRLDKTIAYVEEQVSSASPSMSLSYGLLGLAAHQRFPPQGRDWQGAALERANRRGVGAHRLALAALAAMGAACPLINLQHRLA